MLNIVFILMIIMSVAAVQTPTLRHAVLYLAAFSLLCSLAYLLYQAPDVAIAEAAIGCTLSTVLYLVALKKYAIFRVYYSRLQRDPLKHIQFEMEHSILLGHLHKYLLSIELELDMINTHKTADEIEKASSYDIIVEHRDETMTIYGSEANYHFEGLKDYMSGQKNFKADFQYIIEEDGDEE